MPRRPARSDEVPEADALEQDQALVDGDDADDEVALAADTERLATRSAEVPEADALEQATPVAEADDDWHDR
jgi:hypothetical protein